MEKRKTLSEQAGSSQSDLSHCHLDYTNLRDLCCHVWHGGIQACVVTKNHIWECFFMQFGPVIDVHCPWYHQRPQGCLAFGPQPVTMVLSGDHAAIKA